MLLRRLNPRDAAVCTWSHRCGPSPLCASLRACVACGNAFVKRSASWRVVSTLSGIRCPRFFQSWTAKCWVEMCRLALHLAFCAAHWRAAALSTIRGVGCNIVKPIDACSLRTKRVSRAALFMATISASAEPRAMDF